MRKSNPRWNDCSKCCKVCCTESIYCRRSPGAPRHSQPTQFMQWLLYSPIFIQCQQGFPALRCQNACERHVAGELWQLARRDATVTPQISGNIAPLFPLLCHPLPQDTMVVETSKAICPSSHSYVPSSEGTIGYLSIFPRWALREYWYDLHTQ